MFWCFLTSFFPRWVVRNRTGYRVLLVLLIHLFIFYNLCNIVFSKLFLNHRYQIKKINMYIIPDYTSEFIEDIKFDQ
jgi:hypothetical protein